MNSVLVTGGAGYIGSHMVRALLRAGYRVVILDNLSEGHRAAVQDTELAEVDVADRGAVRALMRRHRPHAIMHFAAFCSVKESVENPLKYYHNNVAGTISLLDAALEVIAGAFGRAATGNDGRERQHDGLRDLVLEVRDHRGGQQRADEIADPDNHPVAQQGEGRNFAAGPGHDNQVVTSE